MGKPMACLCLFLMGAFLMPAAVLAQAAKDQTPTDDTPAKTTVKKSKKKQAKKARKARKAAAQTTDAAQTADAAQTSDSDESLDKKYVGDTKEKPTKRYFRFEFKLHPAIRMGKWFRMDFRLKFEHDFRTFDPEVSTDEGELSNLRRFRVGIQGYVTKNFEYEIERELRNEIGDWFHLRTRPTLALWRDVYGNWRYFRRV